jgi:hypothetical protein
MIEAASVGGLFRISAAILDRLDQSLHGELDGSRREVAPDLKFGLELLLGEAHEIFPYCPPGGRAFPDEFLAYKRVSWHGVIKAPCVTVGNRFRINLSRA